MTNEQIKAKELAILLTAFADGKQLEWFNQSHWIEIPIACSLENFLVDYNIGVPYRIKPETKRIALTRQDLIERRKLGFEAVWVKSKLDFDYEFMIEQIRPDGCMIHGSVFAYEDLVEYFVFLDGTPCYKEVKCE